jgi:uncharacterized protein (DUF433 family)
MPMALRNFRDDKAALRRECDVVPSRAFWGRSYASQKLERIANRQARQRYKQSDIEEDLRVYSAPLVDVFLRAAKECTYISVAPDVMAGAPCVSGTRIPVYGVLDAIWHHGSLKGALRSYPRLNEEQVKDVMTFAKLVVECPLED